VKGVLKVGRANDDRIDIFAVVELIGVADAGRRGNPIFLGNWPGTSSRRFFQMSQTATSSKLSSFA